MQTKVITRTETDTQIRNEVTRIVAHDNLSVTQLNVLYGQDEVEIELKKDRNVLDISSSPSAVLGIRMDGGEAEYVSRIILIDHTYSTVAISSKGVIRGVCEITGMTQTGESELTITQNGYLANRTQLVGGRSLGPYSLEGEYFYLIMGDYSEQKVILTNVGILDENGDAYPYDEEDSNMENLGDGEGRYINPSGAIVAEAMQRCINDIFGEEVVTVSYSQADWKFYITSLLNHVSYMNIPLAVDGIQDGLGFDRQQLIQAENASGLYVWIPGMGPYQIMDSYGDTVIISATIPSLPHPTKMYIVDPNMTAMVAIQDN